MRGAKCEQNEIEQNWFTVFFILLSFMLYVAGILENNVQLQAGQRVAHCE